jgi:hypothetical protein
MNVGSCLIRPQNNFPLFCAVLDISILLKHLGAHLAPPEMQTSFLYPDHCTWWREGDLWKHILFLLVEDLIDAKSLMIIASC